MVVWKTFGIVDGQDIKDIISYAYDDSGEIKSKVEAVRRFGNNGDSVDITLYRAGIGCKYINGKLYREDGTTEIAKHPSDEEEIASINETVDDILVEILGG